VDNQEVVRPEASIALTRNRQACKVVSNAGETRQGRDRWSVRKGVLDDVLGMLDGKVRSAVRQELSVLP
jgi:hypothetical protein